jgi:hypothetical protein
MQARADIGAHGRRADQLGFRTTWNNPSPLTWHALLSGDDAPGLREPSSITQNSKISPTFNEAIRDDERTRK